jgi:hypothetical protein
MKTILERYFSGLIVWGRVTVAKSSKSVHVANSVDDVASWPVLFSSAGRYQREHHLPGGQEAVRWEY